MISHPTISFPLLSCRVLFIYLFIYLFRFANKLHVYENNKSKFTHIHRGKEKNPVWQGHHNSFRQQLTIIVRVTLIFGVLTAHFPSC